MALAKASYLALAQEINNSLITFNVEAFKAALRVDSTINEAFSEFIRLLEVKWTTKITKMVAKDDKILATIETIDDREAIS